MTVKELIELNQMITDAEITVRKEGYLLDQLNIGPARGIKPPYPTRVPRDEKYLKNFGMGDHKMYRDAAYIPKSINSWDDGKDYWQVKPERIPKKWLDLEVYGWNVRDAHTVGTTSPRRGGCHKNINFHGEEIHITALPNGQSLEVHAEDSQENDKQIDGQMNIFDITM